MALRRSITARAKQLYEQYRVAPPYLTHIHRDDDNCENLPHDRLFGTGNNLGTFHGSRNFFNDRRFSIPAVCGPAFLRNMSSLGKGPAEKIEIVTDVADVLGEGAVEVAAQVSPMVNEVAAAVAAADSSLPVALLQYLIGHVHTISGFNWWASIVLTTILIRWSQIPFRIYLNKFKPLILGLYEIDEDMRNRDMSPAAVAEGQAHKKELFKEYGPLNPPLMGSLILNSINLSIDLSFFFAVANMAKNVPSFQEGGAFWFTDLTTPDSMYIFPVLSALSFWIAVECNDDMKNDEKNVCRAVAVSSIPLAATFIPKAMFCYWITSNLFTIAYGLALQKPEVKKLGRRCDR